MTIRITALKNLPCAGFDNLLEDSLNDGYKFMQRLADDWSSGANRFSKPGEILLIASKNGVSIGVGGLNIDPYLNDLSVGRIRHLYIHTNFRRHGLGKHLLSHLTSSASSHFTRLTLRTDNPNAYAFYEACGFSQTDKTATATHELLLPGSTS